MASKVLVAVALFMFSCFICASAISWNGNWGLSCEFPGKNLSNSKILSEECGTKCAKTPNCTHFVWSGHANGTCWLKTGNVSQWDAIPTNDPTMICGISANGVKLNILATYHDGEEVGLCELPKIQYNSPLPIALGMIPQLGELQYNPELCGHLMNLNCGLGPVEVMVITQSIGCGIDMFPSTWELVTGGMDPGQVNCSIYLSDKPALPADKPQCYHATQETGNHYWRKVALLNTRKNLVVGASLKGIEGTREGAFFQLSTKATAKDKIKFRYADGTVYTVALGDCRPGNKAVWT